MPVLKHAKKKLRQDKARTAKNKKQKEQYKDLIKAARKNATNASVSAAFTAIDKAAKNNLIHKNKAARLKSSLSKLLAGDKKASSPAKAEAKPAAKKATTTKKPSSKKSSAKTSKK